MSKAMVISRHNGGLEIQAAPGLAQRLRKLGGRLQANGLWWLDGHREALAQRLGVIPKPQSPRPVTKKPIPSRAATHVFGSAAEAANRLDAVPRIAEITIFAADLYIAGIRLTPPRPEAVALVKSLAGRSWNTRRGCWYVPIHAEHAIEAIEGVVAAISALPPQDFPDPHPVARIYPIENAPDLGTMVLVDGVGEVVFEASGRMFRLHEGHGRQHPHLAGHVGQYGCVLYGRGVCS